MANRKLQIKKQKKIKLVQKGKPSTEDLSQRNFTEEEILGHEVTEEELAFLKGLSVIEEKRFSFYCYRCGHQIMVPISWAKTKISCEECTHDIIVPPPLEKL